MSRAVKAGLIAGVVVSLFSVLHHFVNLQDETLLLIYRFIPITISVIAIFFSVKTTRDASPEGTIDFKGALRAGVITATINTLIYAAVNFAIYKTTDPQVYKNEFRAVLDQEITKVTAPKDSAERAQKYISSVATADSLFNKQEFEGAVYNYIQAMAMKPGDKHVEDKLRYLVDLRITEFTSTPVLLQSMSINSVFQVIIGGVIAVISFFFLRKGEKVF